MTRHPLSEEEAIDNFLRAAVEELHALPDNEVIRLAQEADDEAPATLEHYDGLAIGRAREFSKAATAAAPGFSLISTILIKSLMPSMRLALALSVVIVLCAAFGFWGGGSHQSVTNGDNTILLHSLSSNNATVLGSADPPSHDVPDRTSSIRMAYTAEASVEAPFIAAMDGPVVRDPAELKQLYIEANRGKAHALLRLGVTYEKGWAGVAADPQSALSYYKRASAKGSAFAHLRVGYFYETGAGGKVSTNSKEALKYYKLALIRGNAETKQFAQERINKMRLPSILAAPKVPEKN